MEWEKFVDWLASQWPALVSLGVAAFAAWQAHKAIVVTRAYKDPVFVMECAPMHLADAPMLEEPRGIEMFLVNKGDSFARDVRWSANFDPYGIKVSPQEWPHIEGKGGRVRVMTPFTVSSMVGMPILEDLLRRKDDAAYATVAFTSQSGHKVRQKVLLPNPYDFRLPQPVTADDAQS